MPISIQRSGDSITVNGAGPLLADCLTAVQQCADTNGCLTNGLSITDKCISTLARHNQTANCASEGFGLAGGGGKGGKKY